jgi:type II secretory pathway pseudopilin PulG
VELVIVVTIIGVVAAIAVPRVSNTSSNASANALQATLLSVRTAIDCYYAEHNKYPGYQPGTTTPNGVEFVKQLTMYTDVRGNTNAMRSGTFKFGPYLRAPFPASPVNKLRTVHVKPIPVAPNPPDASVGWVAVLSDGDFGVSASDTQLDEVGIVEVEEKQFVKLLR